MSDLTHYKEAFGRFTGSALSKELLPLRQSAMERFSAAGFPTTRNEEWKYTNIAPLATGRFEPATAESTIDKQSLEKFLIAGTDVHLFVFINGFLSTSLSRIGELPKGIIAGKLSDHIAHPAVKSHLGAVAGASAGSMVEMNTAFMAEGAFLYVPKQISVSKPIHFLFINNGVAGNVLVTPRNLFVAEEGASVQVIESFHTVGSVNNCFTNAVTEIHTGPHAHLDLTKVQLEDATSYHIGYTAADQETGSEFHITTITLDGAIVRNNLNIRLNGEQSNTWLYGLYCLNGTQLVDNHSLVDHAVPHCNSNELYKGIVDGKAQGVFNGKIFVRKDAQKTNAYQSNKNILLSDEASMNTKPQLEIFADDVKCSHGTTTGQLDEEALFYLRSRGIGEDNARAFLNIAFAGDVIQKIAYEPLRQHLMELMERKLKGESL
ncbi:MAG: Fe-S cluster assembly protein SufD [Bacteroidota bacterium]|jgi:Fe-S cluster assembly protein SufD